MSERPREVELILRVPSRSPGHRWITVVFVADEERVRPILEPLEEFFQYHSQSWTVDKMLDQEVSVRFRRR